MNYPAHTGRACAYNWPDASSPDDYLWHATRGFTHWNPVAMGQPAAPTVSEIQTILASPGYAAWLDEHGGDPALTLRREAKELLDSQAREAVVQRASDIEIGLYVRDAHRNLNQLLAGIAAANNLADVKAAAADIVQSPAPTNDAAFVSGARAAIVARIDAGEGDS